MDEINAKVQRFTFRGLRARRSVACLLSDDFLRYAKLRPEILGVGLGSFLTCASATLEF